MPYIGNQHNVGDHVNNFKVLDDISSHTATFDGSATSIISAADDTIRIPEHRFIQGQRVTYTNGGGGNIGGLTSGTAYFISFDTANTIKLATTLANANSNTVINLTAVGSGTSHTLNAAFDGVNTKFKMTHSSGKAARLNNATQINVAINNVIQRPNVNSVSFTEGFALEDNHKIVFKTAPIVNDIFWGSIIANTIENFDLRDNEVDNFTGDASTTEFTLSTIPANNESVAVTIDGVLQHPSDKNTTRAYTLIDSIIQFTAAPALNSEIQVRHIGFAGATTNDVSGFYGRTGNVALTSSDHITTGDITSRNINSSGIVTASTFDGAFTGNVVGTSATFTGNLTVGGVLTYEDVTNVDSVGIITAQKDIHVGAGVSVVGIVTAATFKGDGDFVDIDVDGHTNLDNVSIAGVSTFGEGIFIPDQKILRLGNTAANPDFKFEHNSANNNTIFSETGDLHIHARGNGDFYLKANDDIFIKPNGGGEEGIRVVGGDAVQLYHANNKRAETLSNGFQTQHQTPIFQLFGENASGTRSSNGYLNFYLRDGNSNNYSVARVLGAVDNSNGGYGCLEFQTAFANSLSTKMIITREGRVGIGSTNPSAILHLHKASGDTNQKIESSNGAASLELRHTNGYGYIRYLQDGTETFRAGQIAQFTSYSIYNPNSSLPYQFCVEGNGEVGINTHNPANTLHLLRNTNHGIYLQKGGTNPGSALIQVASFGALNLEASNNLTLQSGGSQQIFFNRGGTTVAKFDTSGRFGINETSNINGRLHVQHDALGENILYATRYNDQTNDKPILAVTEALMTGMTASGLVIGNHNRGIHIGPVFDDSAAVQTASKTGIRIAYTGNVGINSAMPAQKLDVDGIIRGSSYFQAGSNTTASNNWHFGAEATGQFRVYTGNYGAGEEKLRILSSGKPIIRLDTGSTNNTYQIAAEFNARTTGSASASFGPALHLSHTFGGTNYAGVLIASETNTDVNTANLVFYPRNYGYTAALRITHDGRLVMTNAATKTFADFTTTNNSTRGLISVAGKDGSGNAVTVKIGGFGDTSRGEIFTHSNHSLGFATNNAATQMTLDTGGKLLIGATAATLNAKLQVSGRYVDASASTLNLNGTGTDGPCLELFDSGNTANRIALMAFNHGSLKSAIGGGRSNTGNWGTDLRFYTHKEATSDQYQVYEKMRIRPDGITTFGSSGSPYQSNTVSVHPDDGMVCFGMDGRTSLMSGQNSCYIFSGSGASGDIPAGTLILQARSNVDRNIVFATGSTPTRKWQFSGGSGAFQEFPYNTGTSSQSTSNGQGYHLSRVRNGQVPTMTSGNTYTLFNTNTIGDAGAYIVILRSFEQSVTGGVLWSVRVVSSVFYLHSGTGNDGETVDIPVTHSGHANNASNPPVTLKIHLYNGSAHTHGRISIRPNGFNYTGSNCDYYVYKLIDV